MTLAIRIPDDLDILSQTQQIPGSISASGLGFLWFPYFNLFYFGIA
jgi:hypothetical protein